MDLKDLSVKEGSVKAAMLEILADGEAHERRELHACCGPSDLTQVSNHIVELRKVLKPYGMTIVCEYAYRKYHYRQVRLLRSQKE
jgi:hypothetical protein